MYDPVEYDLMKHLDKLEKEEIKEMALMEFIEQANAEVLTPDQIEEARDEFLARRRGFTEDFVQSELGTQIAIKEFNYRRGCARYEAHIAYLKDEGLLRRGME